MSSNCQVPGCSFPNPNGRIICAAHWSAIPPYKRDKYNRASEGENKVTAFWSLVRSLWLLELPVDLDWQERRANG